jgi:murein DD-endopeptidase MepM/ murein hydrolase activator NlpD
VPSRRRHRRPRRLVLAAVAAGTLAAAAPALAEPAAIREQRAEVARLSERLGALDARLADATARLQASQGRLRAVVERMRRNRVVLIRVTQELDRSRGVLAGRLVDLYTRPDPTLADLLVGTESVTGIVSELGAIERAGRQDGVVVGRIRGTRVAVVALRRELARDRVLLRRETAQAEARQAEVGGLVERQRDVLAGAEGELRRLVAAERERQRREAERRRREREEQRRREAEARRQAEIAREQAEASSGGWSPTTPTWTAPAPSGGGLAYPLGVRGDVVGTPYSGTHTLGNWQSDRALDIVIPVGTPVYAVDSGTIGSIGGGGSGRFAGMNLHLNTASDSFFYAHLSSVAVSSGQSVSRGQVIAWSGSANGVPHLHIGVQNGDPYSVAGGG